MGREIRRVPGNWEHPKDENGHKPLFGGCFADHTTEWDVSNANWQQGLCRSYAKDGPEWESISVKYKGMPYAEYAGPRPDPDRYMPQWSEEEKTHLQMYECTTEGTPISPVCATIEELARWLTDNNASAFAGMPASYEAWFNMCKRGSAPTAFCVLGVGIISGVAGISEF